MEVFFELLAEIALQIVGELLFELGIRAGVRAFASLRRSRSPVVAAAVYLLIGALAGLVSVLVFPQSFLREPWMRIVNLVVAPLLAGALMAAWGAYRRKRSRFTIRLDSFGYGFAFAMAFALVRFFGTGAD